jgi:two-component system NtrC family sensor kinase
MKWKHTIWFRLMLGTVAVVLVANAILSTVTVLYVSRVLVDEVESRVRLDLNSARRVYDGHGQRILDLLLSASYRHTLPTPLTTANLGRVDEVLSAVRRHGRFDMLSLLDRTGRVVWRAHAPGRTGDDLGDDAVVARVRRNHEPYWGTMVLSRERLEREGAELAERAYFRIRETPNARPTTRTEERDGMVMAAVVPLVDLNRPDEVQGYLYGADLLSRRFDIVDAIKSDVFRDMKDGGRDLGTATIFQGDLRVSTNVRARDGSRAVGTRLSAEVTGAVLERGETFAGRAFVVTDWYISSYEPIRDPDGKIIGSLYVGVLEQPFRRPQTAIVTTFLIAVGVATAASLALLLLVTRAVLRPISRVVRMADRVVAGDLTARLGLRPAGEMGALCAAIDRMADAVGQREDKLKEAMRQQLNQTEKLASVGRLAAGVAHEVNNPLTGVLTFAHLMREKTNLDDEDRQSVEVIIHETTRVREIVRGLLDFARESPMQLRTLDLGDVVRQSLELVRRQKAFVKLQLEERYHAVPLPISADRNRLQQVVLNLLLNAAEAMAGGGTLTIATGVRDERAFVAITDTGTGIKQAVLEHIFEPFFTTKPVGSGTGLGLSVSYGIIQQHKGVIEVESEEGRGSTFTILLPKVPPEPASGGGKPS